METDQCPMFKIPPGSTLVTSGENYYGIGGLYGEVDGFVPCYPGPCQCPPLQGSMGFRSAQYLDSPRDRCLIIERFSDVVYSSQILPYDASRILHDMHTFVLAHSQAPIILEPPRTAGGTLFAQPMQLEGSVRASEEAENGQGAAALGGSEKCCFGDCRRTIDEVTTAGIRKHLRVYHSAELMTPGERIRCRWDHCSRRSGLTKTHLAKHIATTHFKIEEVRCGVSGCEELFSRRDARKRHVEKKHVGQAT